MSVELCDPFNLYRLDNNPSKKVPTVRRLIHTAYQIVGTYQCSSIRRCDYH